MTEPSPTDAPENVPPPDSAAAGDAAQTPPPRRPKVFGRFGFFITVVPFVFYLAGMMFASYLETSRAHARVKQQAGVALATVGVLKEQLRAATAGQAAEFEKRLNAWNVIAIEDMLREAEEGFEATRLEKLLQPLKSDTYQAQWPPRQLAQEQLSVLLKMRELEEQHKTREVLQLSHAHFADLRSASGQELDSTKIATDTATAQEWFPPDKTWYPTTYTIVIAGTAVLMLLAFPGYFKVPCRVSWLSVAVGVVGVVVWIGLIELDRRWLHLGQLLNPHGRDAFNPFVELKGNPTWMWQFLAIRFTGLVLIVPFIEEFFLRGWLMRYIDDPDWDEMPIGEARRFPVFGLVAPWAIWGVIAYGVVSHVGEPLAAAAWFGLVTWLYLRTKSIWDCAVAHAVTNLLMGIFVLLTGSWYLW